MSERLLRVLGVMTGTSCDGLDAVCVVFTGENSWKIEWSAARPYPKALRDRVLRFQKPGSRWSSRDWLELHRDLGDWYGSALAAIIAARSPAERPHAIANHGQTVAHFPAGARKGTTLQMGDPTRIARATGLTVVAGFRDGDMAAGGQGAPLLPLFHRMLAANLGHHEGGVSIHNIGGVSNLTYLGPKGEVIAFDTGPGNFWIDAATEKATRGRMKFDKGGALGAKGTPDERAVEAVLKHRYFKLKPPKSTGRDDFPYSLLKTRARGNDLVATATAVTVESIARDYERWIIGAGLPLHTVYVCGGGARNTHLIRSLSARLPEVRFADLAARGFDPQHIEATGFAVFGWLALRGRPVGGSWTGAEGFGPPAHIVPGENWGDVAGWASGR